MSKTESRKKLHIHGNDISKEEAAEVARHFGVSDISRIPAGDVNEVKKALTSAAKSGGVILFQRGMHFIGVLNMSDMEWFTFERDGGHVVIRRKTPGNHELPEVARIMTVAATAS